MSITRIKPGDVVSFKGIGGAPSNNYYVALNDIVGNTIKVRIHRIDNDEYRGDGYLYTNPIRDYPGLEFFYYSKMKEYQVDQEPLEDEDCL